MNIQEAFNVAAGIKYPYCRTKKKMFTEVGK